MPKPRIADPRIRAQIEGPFTAVRTSIASAVMLEESAHSLGLFVIRYQHNYVCVSQNGDPTGQSLDELEKLARAKDIRCELVAAGAENVVEALMVCYGHLKERDPKRALEISHPGLGLPVPAPVAAQEEYPTL